MSLRDTGAFWSVKIWWGLVTGHEKRVRKDEALEEVPKRHWSGKKSNWVVTAKRWRRSHVVIICCHGRGVCWDAGCIEDWCSRCQSLRMWVNDCLSYIAAWSSSKALVIIESHSHGFHIFRRHFFWNKKFITCLQSWISAIFKSFLKYCCKALQKSLKDYPRTRLIQKLL